MASISAYLAYFVPVGVLDVTLNYADKLCKYLLEMLECNVSSRFAHINR